ncbi:MAG: hypothetical protein GC129_06320 [Proteobacteria bacterium]|nr:hypothetical protein [Pseudomonadota bacterium]
MKITGCLPPARPHRLAMLAAPWVPALALLLVVAVYAYLCVAVNGGYFGYTLDDAYIHLAQAEGIWAGGWGVNPGEASAPSSSFLWPLLLAPFSPFAWQDKVPFVLATASLLVAAAASWRLLRDAWPQAWVGNGALALLVLAMALGCNGPQLVFCGLEHCLVAACLVLALGILPRVQKGKVAPTSALLGLAMLPFVRFEMALPAACLGLMLVVDRRWREVAMVAVVGGALLAAYVASVVTHGLPWLPSSVLAKAGFGGGAGAYVSQKLAAFYAAGGTYTENLAVGGITVCALVAAGLAVVCRVAGSWRPALMAAALWLTALTLPIRYSYDLRYHAPLLWAEVLCVLVLAGAVLPTRLALPRPRLRHAAVAALLALLVWALPNHSWRQPWAVLYAVLNTHAEHYQMHRLVTEFYKGPVAVHDIGWVSYRNPHYVLDLAGLANDDVRRIVAAHGPLGPDELRALVSEHGVGLVMVYDNWFPPSRLPPEWHPVALLVMTWPVVSAGSAVVTLYATRPGEEERIMAAVRAMVPSLLPGTLFALPGTVFVKTGAE